MKYVGAHVSSLGGVHQAVYRSHLLGSSAFAFFTKNQLRWKSPELTNLEIEKFVFFCEKYHFSSQHILPHSSYLINLGHPNLESLLKSRIAFVDEAMRCIQLGLQFLNFHPGSHLNQINEMLCLNIIADSINYAIDRTEKIIFVIENTAGQGSNVGYCFEHLSTIINRIHDKSRIGVCLDTCHLFASGYDLRTEFTFMRTFDEFHSIVGFQFLCGLHVNDSRNILNSRVDRHHNLGYGYIGHDCFSRIMKDKRFQNIPIILETCDSSIWKKEIRWLLDAM